MTETAAPRRRLPFLQWLRRVHAWTGFWGALAFLLMGCSGILLNHRTYLKIDTGEPQEVSAVDIRVPPGSIASADDLGRWSQTYFHASQAPKPPRDDEGGKKVRFAGEVHDVPAVWKRELIGPNGRIEVSYVAGASVVHAARKLNSPLAVLKNLHKGNGLPLLWVLFIDTIGGALITQSLTGVLLWTRFHGPRLAAAALMGGSLAFALAAAWGAFV